MPSRGPPCVVDARKVRVQVSNTKTLSVPALGGEQSLNRYLSEIKKFPVLTQEQEYMLAKRYEEHDDPEAAAQLVTSHLRLVAKIAMGYRGYGLPVSELISEGNIGLMQGVKKFEADRGFRLATYAMWWIKASIQEYILRSWSLVKMGTTAAQKKLFFNLRSQKKKLAWLNHDELQAVAKDLGVEPRVVREMEGRLASQDTAFDGPMDDDEDSAYQAPAYYLEDRRSDPAVQLENADWSEDSNGRLMQAMENLDERSQDILRERWLTESKSTLHELADKYGVSAERIRQLEVRAFDKVQKAVTAVIAEEPEA